jgi:chromosome segregation protein
MHITKLRLLGFKSFVEPTELLIEPGLTGVVGPNGCGKSNLLEALRWSMGETSTRSMRASAMDDVIFNGTTSRPARDIAEVTLFVDNAARTAPADFNDRDVLEVTRRIEREMGSTYRVNGREVRARDIKLLFDDAATGARSPALVRQGQIGEVVNAKPEQRRRILEDAAGIAGLHTRRHEAELRLKAAEANLARVTDVLEQLGGQLETLKRQARQARRYKELSADIRRAEALLLLAHWRSIEVDLTAGEAEFARASAAAAGALEVEHRMVSAEHAAVSALPAARQADAAAGAAVQRIRLEREALARSAAQASARRQELEARSAQTRRDLQRERALVEDVQATTAKLLAEQSDLEHAEQGSADAIARADAAVAAVEAAAAQMEQRLAGLQMAAAEARARRASLEALREERQSEVATAAARLREAGLQAADTADCDGLRTAAGDANDLVETLAAAGLDLEVALEQAIDRARADQQAAVAAGAAHAAARLALTAVEAEVRTLEALLPAPAASPPLSAALDVPNGEEPAVGAALGDDLDASLDRTAAQHWAGAARRPDDPTLPEGAIPLEGRVKAPAKLARRLAQTGLVASVAAGERLQEALKPGQTLVTAAGDLWRWDGFVARAGARTGGQLLVQRRRLDELRARAADARAGLDTTAVAEADAARAAHASDAAAQRLTVELKGLQARLSEARPRAVAAVRAADAAAGRRQVSAAGRVAAQAAHDLAVSRLNETLHALAEATEPEALSASLDAALDAAAERRAAVAMARADRAGLDRARSGRANRRLAIADELARLTQRRAAAEEQVQVLEERLLAAADLLANDEGADPQVIAAREADLRAAQADAEATQRQAADALVVAETRFRTVQGELRSAQQALAAAREAAIRIETRLEAVRQRRLDHIRVTQEAMGVLPEACLELAAHDPATPVPPVAEIEPRLAALRAERDRLGGVNLAADDDLTEAQARYDGLDRERADVAAAVGTLHEAIGVLNRDAKGRLETAFQQVDGHFRRLFEVLFGGGEARLELIRSETDPMQGGLEIIAKPPGKKPATLSLLSGGEQTLTALSLIFAVFLTNPSPICVLDEVDAPLDDSNVDRFCTLMERMAADTDTRFLVITHHPMTMARMHRLFGVTMGERGVSQLVSVDLEAAQRIVEAEAA